MTTDQNSKDPASISQGSTPFECTFEDLQYFVIKWAKDRKIIPNAKAHTQLLKTFEEMGELASGEAKNDIDLIQDSVGDVLVCLIIYCFIRNIDMVGCLMLAYDEIKDRKGTLTPDGVFIKESA